MALNFMQVLDKVKQIGLGARAHQESLDDRREQARLLLTSWADKTTELNEKVERARRVDPGIRCALPPDGVRLDAGIPEPEPPPPLPLLAADGSQILPDRHAALHYSLVNVGAIAIQPGSGQAPDIFTDSSLLFADELFTETGMLSGEAIEQRRDIAERKKLLELASSYSTPVIALTDGPVELWGAKNGVEGEYRRNLEIHRSILSQLQEREAIVAGYVDKPGADLVVRLLEIVLCSSEQEFEKIREFHPLRGVTDRWLFGFLDPGSRSTIFGLQSTSRQHYTGDLSLNFFYLNVGYAKHASLVRVEIPRWVAAEDGQIDRLHSALLQQCRLMGARPYPYILARAHEIAVVKFEEKRQVEQMLALELRRGGAEIEDESNKKSAKELPGRTRP